MMLIVLTILFLFIIFTRFILYVLPNLDFYIKIKQNKLIDKIKLGEEMLTIETDITLYTNDNNYFFNLSFEGDNLYCEAVEYSLNKKGRGVCHITKGEVLRINTKKLSNLDNSIFYKYLPNNKKSIKKEINKIKYITFVFIIIFILLC